MARSVFVLAIKLLLILKVCASADSTTSKRLQKCRSYEEQVYGQGVRSCVTSTDTVQPITTQESPYVAILGNRENRNENSTQYSWYCHGTLVSSRYVLSTAYCLNKTDLVLLKVRLGEGSPIFSDEFKSTDYDVESIILHPRYNRYQHYNDIGLIKLSLPVKLSVNVRPICLPDTDHIPSIVYQVNYESSQQPTSDQRPFKKYENDIVPNDACNLLVARLGNRKLRDGITDELMCYNKTSTVSDDYEPMGEAGAPVYINQPQVPCSHVQLGIASFGPRIVGTAPEVATKVYNFADWIESIIWVEDEDITPAVPTPQNSRSLILPLMMH